ncbi:MULTISPECIES: hypothetical protein [Salinibaculum]|uniref:hypothetical protein n=1 Tax=Salinibaculum TaxID=2732368 RepID=UPI0030D529D8
MNVVNDANGLITLQPGAKADERVYYDSGSLVIDFTSDHNDDGVVEGQGVNVDSRYQVGYFGKYDWMPPEDKIYPPESAGSGDPYELPAFSILNQDTIAHSITIGYDFTSDPGGSEIFIMGSSRSADAVDSSSNIPKRSDWFPGGDGELVFKDYGDDGQPGDIRLKPGGRIGVSLFIDTTGGSTDDDLSGTLTVSSD